MPLILWLLCLALFAAGGYALAAKLFPAQGSDRAAAAVTFALVAPVVLVRAAGALGLLRPAVLLGGALCLAALLFAASAALAGERSSLAVARSDARRLVGGSPGGGSSAWLVAAPGLVAVAVAIVAAGLLPIWAWDSLGYHLPIVWDALQTGTLRWVPTSVPYINVYPRSTELAFVFCRALLGHDQWIDLAQLPYGVGAAIGIAALAGRAGAPAPRAVAYGIAYLAVPLVALQLASNYVDVAYAAALILAGYFATGPLRGASLPLLALSLGLLLSTKPTAPPAVALLAVVAAGRGLGSRRVAPAVAAAAGIALGAESYVRTFLRFGNPVYPIQLHLGPISLPGQDPAGPLFVQGLPPPYGGYGWVRRVLVSWFVEPFPAIYDMRMGGLGIAFAYGLIPIAVYALVRRRAAGVMPAASWATGLVFVGSIASPAAHWSRFSLAAPAALLALAAVVTRGFRSPLRAVADGALAVLLSVGLLRALPGFTDHGPSLWAVAHLPEERRGVYVGVDRAEPAWQRARDALVPGDAAAYDASLGLPGRLYRPDGAIAVEYMDGTRSDGELLRWLDERRVRLVVAGGGTPAGRLAEALPTRFRPLFRCIDDPCVVYGLEPAVAGERQAFEAPPGEDFR